MARNIQSATGRPETGKTFIGLLGNAIFWLVVATAVPFHAIAGAFPEAAMLIQKAPVLFYLLALWSFVRALRTLQRLTAGRARTLFQSRGADVTQKQKPQSAKQGLNQGAKQAKTKASLPVTRAPTVQRMR